MEKKLPKVNLIASILGNLPDGGTPECRYLLSEKQVAADMDDIDAFQPA
jgi:hypothetical protein